MADATFVEHPIAKEIYMLLGWRQWADAGSLSSGLPKFLIDQHKAYKIGEINAQGFYIFQIPGTHDLVRPTIKFEDGYPVYLERARNEFFYAGDEQRGVVYFLGDEPHLNITRYTDALLDAARTLKVKRMVGFGGVYGEVPYTKARVVSCTYSQKEMKPDLEKLAVRFSDYHGGSSINAYLCQRAAEQGVEYLSLYGFVPAYDFSKGQSGSSIVQIENDYIAWLEVMRRVNYLFNLEIDLSNLEAKSRHLRKLMDAKISEIAKSNPELGVNVYLQQLEDEFDEIIFEPLQDLWEDEISRLLGKTDEK